MKELNEKELNEFVEKYIKPWGKDIKKVTYVEHKNHIEYLVNGHYLFVTKKEKKQSSNM